MRQSRVLQWLVYNWPIKILSLIAALLFYVFIQIISMDERVLSIPLEVTVPGELVIESTVPEHVLVTIQGDTDIIYMIIPELLNAHVDFSGIEESGVVSVPVVLETALLPEWVRKEVSISLDPGLVRVMVEQEKSSAGLQTQQNEMTR